MSRYHEVIARIAVDPLFAEDVRAHPTEVGAAYGLSAAELKSILHPADLNSVHSVEKSVTEPETPPTHQAP